MDRTQQALGDRLRTARGAFCQPGVDHFQVAADFRLQDLEQHRINGEQRAVAGIGIGDRWRRGVRRRGHGLVTVLVTVLVLVLRFGRRGRPGIAGLFA